MRNKYKLWRRIILAVVLLCLILAGFSVYLHATRKITVERNSNYVSDAASQTAKRIDDLLVGAKNSISAIAHMYEQSLDPLQADVKILDELTQSTVFDYIGYVNAKGIYTDNLGRQADVSDRHYVQDGLRGNSGMDMIFHGRLSGEDPGYPEAERWSRPQGCRHPDRSPGKWQLQQLHLHQFPWLQRGLCHKAASQ